MESQYKALIRVAAIALLTLALVYLAKLSGLAMATYGAEQDEAELSAGVTQVAISVEALGTAVVEVESDEYVEKWAREERKWSRDGDHPIAIVPVEETDSGAAGTAKDDLSAWERLKGWLSGDD